MSILKNDIPILEFDSNPDAVINPDHVAAERDIRFPSVCIYAFLGEHTDIFAKENNIEPYFTFNSQTKIYPIYVDRLGESDYCFCQAPVGSAASAQILDWLIAHGVKKIISVGSCGCLVHFDEGQILVPTKALRDEGTSYHYAPPARYAYTSSLVNRTISETVGEYGLNYREVFTWTTDGFFRETKELVEYRKSEGCEVVEMECAALCSVAELRGVDFGAMLYTADTLADVNNYDERDWGGDISGFVFDIARRVAGRLVD